MTRKRHNRGLEPAYRNPPASAGGGGNSRFVLLLIARECYKAEKGRTHGANMPAKIHRILQPVTPATEVAGCFTTVMLEPRLRRKGNPKEHSGQNHGYFLALSPVFTKSVTLSSFLVQ